MKYKKQRVLNNVRKKLAQSDYDKAQSLVTAIKTKSTFNDVMDIIEDELDWLNDWLNDLGFEKVLEMMDSDVDEVAEKYAEFEVGSIEALDAILCTQGYEEIQKRLDSWKHFNVCGF